MHPEALRYKRLTGFNDISLGVERTLIGDESKMNL